MTPDSKMLDNGPWYKQGWPWFLFGLPAVAVVVSFSLFFIAKHFNVDSPVTDEYSKENMAVTMLIDKQKHAKDLGLSAHATLREKSVSVKLSATQEKDLPTTLHLAIIHSTQERFDQHVLLQKGDGGVYSGSFEPLHPSNWRFQLEDESRTWRMVGNANIPKETEVLEVSIEPFPSGSINQAKSIRPSDS